MAARTRGGPRSGAVEQIFSQVGTVHGVIDPPIDVLKNITSIQYSCDLTDATIVLRKSLYRDIRREFVYAMSLVGLQDAGAGVRAVEQPPATSLIIGEDVYYALIPTSEKLQFVSSSDGLNSVKNHLYTLMEQSRSVDPDAVGTQQAFDAAADTFGDLFISDLDKLVESMLLNPDQDIGIVTALVALGARHEVLLRDLTDWGSTIGAGSAATFSREKNLLEDANLIETSTETDGVGRPPQRLHPASDLISDTDPTRLIEKLSKQR